MKFIDEYRDPAAAHQFAEAITAYSRQPRTIMEICGGQTHSIIKFGVDQLLPKNLTLIHGPGCPVCVTPTAYIDKAIEIASRPDVIFCSFGDMLRVPGSSTDLLSLKATGGDIRTVFSPMDALQFAKRFPEKQVIFFAVGFETTAPTTAMAVYQAKQARLKNFSLLVCHVLVPPAMEAILSSPDNRVEGYLAAGHVCTVMGYHEYEPIAKKYRVPIVVTGFEPLDILHGIYLCVKQLFENRAVVENPYSRSVRKEGNIPAQRLIREVFEPTQRNWRGLGNIPDSGLKLRSEYAEYDTEHRFGTVDENQSSGSTECISGLILQGIKKPWECPAFGMRCTPDMPLGAPMVSSEGVCSAYYRYRRNAG